MKVAGFGFRKQATASSLRAALEAAGGPAGVTFLATIDDKATFLCINMLSDELNTPIEPVDAKNLVKASVSTQSTISQKTRGTGSVAEAAALAAAGPGARLLVSRKISEDRLATCAIAVGDPS